MWVVLTVRVVIIALCLVGVALIALSARAPYRDTDLTRGYAITRVGVAALLAAVAYGTVESHLLDVPPAPRLWVLLVALVWLNWGLFVRIHDVRRTRRSAGKKLP